MTGPPRKFPLRLNQLAPARKSLVRPVGELPQAMQNRMPSGLGLDSAEVRARMVERLSVLGIGDAQVLRALSEVPRHRFVDAALVTQAYEDTSLPIGHGQTISKPSVVARMLELLMGGANARAQGRLIRTLEIGTGCGYQAALLGVLSRQVFSVERVKPLHDKARELLAPLRITTDVRLIYGDGMLGHPPNAPYDGIIAAAGGDALPQTWLDQLAVGGRLVAPVQDSSEHQVLVVIDRTDAGWQRRVHETVQFVPLKSGVVR